MPWTGTQFASRHNKALKGERAEHAARIANATLRSGVPEGEAIAIASKWAKQHRARGGSLLPRRADGGATERIPPIRPPSALIEKAPAPPPGYVDTPYGLVPEKNWQTYRAGRASGGYIPPSRSPQRERDAELLSRGRGQSRETDLNVTPLPPYGAPGGPIETAPSLNWIPQNMGPDTTRISPPFAGGNRVARGGRLAAGGPAPQAPTYQTAAPAVNAQGFVPVPQGGTYNLDLTTGAMQPASSSALQGFAQRGLPIKDPNAPKPPPDPAAEFRAALQRSGVQLDFSGGNSANGSEGDGGGSMRRGGRRASGGPAPMSMSQAAPWWTRSEARGEEVHPVSGLIRGTSGGRQDNVSMNLPAHSHVIPADVVSGWGQGNTDNGAIALQHALSTGPYGMALPKVPTRPPRALTPPRMPKLASGGAADGVRTLVSHGEIIVSPSDVSRIGGGDYDKGHDWIDRMIVDSRKQIIAHQRKLPPPVRE